MRVYLDYNIFISLLNLKKSSDSNYENLIKKIQLKNIFFYSYGHLEEISYILNYRKEDANLLLKLIEKITNNNEILFNPNTLKYIDIKESVNDCFSRVINNIEYNKKIDILFKEKHMNEVSYTSALNSKIINNLKDKNFFYVHHDYFEKFMASEISKIILTFNCNISLVKPLRECLLIFSNIKDPKFNEKFNPFKNNYLIFEIIIDLIFSFLYINNFYKEKIKEKNVYTSKIFDVTHCIFSSKTDIFITSDKPLFHKVLIVFDFLEVKTKVVLISEDSLESDLPLLLD